MIRFDEASKIFLLETEHTAYAMQLQPDGRLCHLYWGEKIGCLQDLPSLEEKQARYAHGGGGPHWWQEYPGWGEGYFNMHAVKATYADGTRNTPLRYARHSMEGDRLSIFLRDPLGLEAELRYVLRPELDIIDRNAVLTNRGTDALTLENAFSALWRFPQTGSYRLTSLAGAWAKEYQLHRQTLAQGTVLLETKTLRSGPTAAPLFMLDPDENASENAGLVYFGTLQWSGNFRFYVEVDEQNDLSVTGGVSDFDFAYPLRPGESFETPVFTGGISRAGFGGGSRLLHRYQRKYLMRPVDAERVMPVIINTYGTFMGAVNEEKVMGIVEKAARVGAEAFIIDAGWSGQGDFYQLGMGDWNINPDRFPGRLVNIARAVHEKGMQFGLWLEPEIAHVDSKLMREHPDWVLRYPGRPVDVNAVGRVFLNFALDEVWQDILEKVIRLVEICQLDYFKMDLNRWVTEIGSTLMPLPEQKTIYVRYVQNLYKFYNALAARFPNILIENCAGGGTRVDLAMTAFSGRINRSDNQDPLDLLKIHEGFTYFMLSKFAGGGCHIAKFYPAYMNGRRSTTKFQATVAMMGSLAIGENLAAVSEEELDEIAALVKRHKELRHIAQQGEVYRLASAWEEPYAVFEYALPDQSEAAVFAFGQSMQFCRAATKRIRLYGLDPRARYAVEGMGVRTGEGLMHAGIQLPLKGDMDCISLRITRVTE